MSFVNKYLVGTSTNEHITRVVPNPDKIPAGYLFAFLMSLHAQLQIDALIYVSVILSIYESELGGILVPLLDTAKMNEIGSRIEEAFERRFEAVTAEDEAQEILSAALGITL